MFLLCTISRSCNSYFCVCRIKEALNLVTSVSASPWSKSTDCGPDAKVRHYNVFWQNFILAMFINSRILGFQLYVLLTLQSFTTKYVGTWTVLVLYCRFLFHLPVGFMSLHYVVSFPLKSILRIHCRGFIKTNTQQLLLLHNVLHLQ